jgi:hypothetical protein
MKPYKLIMRGFIITSLLLMVAVFPLSTAMAYNEGPNNPGVGNNVTGIGTEPWNNPTEITTPGSPYATVTLYQGHRSSNYLVGSQYGFTIPPDAAVTGIEVKINRMASSPNPGIVDNVVSLVKGVGNYSENKALTGTQWPISFTIATYGGPTDLWGASWTADEINSPDFGVVLAVNRGNNGNNVRDAIVDSMQITVYYGYTTTAGVVCGEGNPITYGESVTCMATITGSVVDHTPSGTVDWTSDGNGSFDPNPCTLEGSNDVATCSASYTPSEVGTGTHLITATYNGDNYFSGSDATQAVDVLVRPITVTADPQSKTYGENDPLLTFQVTEGELVFSDTFTGTLVRDAGEAAGSYAILQGTLALSENYDLTYAGNYLTILKANPVCEVTGYEVTYDGTEHMATGTCTGVFGEVLEGLDLSGTAHTEAGVYEDLWTFTDVTGNYNNRTETVYDEISKIAITVVADAKSKLFMQPDPELTYQVTYGELLAGDAFSGNLTREPGEMPGIYPILQGTLSLPQYYEITFEGATLTIITSGLFLPLVYR